MSATATAPKRISRAVVGMQLFIASEAMFFVGLFAAYLSVRSRAPSWPPVGTPRPGLGLALALTVVLMTSSVTQHLATRGDRRLWLLATIALGTLFVAGQAWEWSQLGAEGLSVASDAFGTLFFLVTGAHGLHVIAGLVMLTGLVAGGMGDTRAAHGRIEAVTYYWHFVDVVWLTVLAALYI